MEVSRRQLVVAINSIEVVSCDREGRLAHQAENHRRRHGEVAERPIVQHWKCCVGVASPGVRIPPSPLKFQDQFALSTNDRVGKLQGRQDRPTQSSFTTASTQRSAVVKLSFSRAVSPVSPISQSKFAEGLSIDRFRLSSRPRLETASEIHSAMLCQDRTSLLATENSSRAVKISVCVVSVSG